MLSTAVGRLGYSEAGKYCSCDVPIDFDALTLS